MTSALLLLAAVAAAAPAPPAASTTTARVLSSEDRRRALFLTDLLVEDGRLSEAESLIVERAASDPEPWDWRLRLARLRQAQRRHAEAAAIYRRMLAERGDDPGLLIQYGHQVMAADDLPAAREAFEKARALSDDPVILYELSEIARAQGREGDSRRLGEEALKALEELEGPESARLRLRLRARLRWDDSIEAEYGRLYDKTKDPDALADWAGALIRRGHADAAAEPSALLRERHPVPASRWRLLEHDRLRAAGDDRAADAFLEESLSSPPVDPLLLLAAGESSLRRRRWHEAEDRLALARESPELEKTADELWVEATRRGWHHAGPLLRWRRGQNSEFVEYGAQYSGYPRRGLRLTGEATGTSYNRFASGQRYATSGASLSLAREEGPWTAGVDLDASRLRDGAFAASPGFFGGWEGRGGSVRASAFAGRAWRDMAEAAAANARADEVSVTARKRLSPRISASLTARGDRYTVPGGGARQSFLSPELSYALVQSPFYAALGYRYAALDSKADDSFLAVFPILRRSRIHYATLSAGRQWNRGRLRTDAYVYNGHEPERGRNFGTEQLVGWGFNVEWILPRVVLIAGYDDTREIFEGVGGRSSAVTLTALWRWRGRK